MSGMDLPGAQGARRSATPKPAVPTLQPAVKVEAKPCDACVVARVLIRLQSTR